MKPGYVTEKAHSQFGYLTTCTTFEVRKFERVNFGTPVFQNSDLA